jgi:hypothetical protein
MVAEAIAASDAHTAIALERPIFAGPRERGVAATVDRRHARAVSDRRPLARRRP